MEYNPRPQSLRPSSSQSRLVKWIARENHDEIRKMYLRSPGIINQIIHTGYDRVLTPLLYGIVSGSVESVRTLFECKANVNYGCHTVSDTYPDYELSFTFPLHYAVEVKAKEDMIDLILRRLPEIDAEDGHGRTALGLAIATNQFGTAKQLMLWDEPTLIDAWCKLMYQSQFLDVPASVWSEMNFDDVELATHCHRIAHAAATNGHVEVLKFLQQQIYYDLDTVYQDTTKRELPYEQLQYGINEEPNDTFIRKMNPWSPTYGLIHIAAKSNHIGIIRLLLEDGCHIDTADSEDQTALHYAVVSGCYEIVKLLIRKRCNINLITLQGFSALHLAAYFRQFKCLMLIVQQGINVNTFTIPLKKRSLYLSDNLGIGQRVPIPYENTCFELQRFVRSNFIFGKPRSVLFLAVKQQHYAMAEWLLSIGAVLDDREELHESILNCDFKMANKLLEHIQTTLENDIIREKSALNYMAGRGRNIDFDEATKLVKTYIGKGYQLNNPVDLSGKKVEDGIVNKISMTLPLHAAIEAGNFALYQVFIQNGADVNIANDEVKYPVHLAAASGNVAIMESLIAEGANCSVLTPDGSSILYVAVENNRLEMTKFIISNTKPDINIKVKYENKVLIKPATNESVDLDDYPEIQRMIIHINSEGGFTPLIHSLYGGYSRISEYLLEIGAELNGFNELDLCLRAGMTRSARLILSYNKVYLKSAGEREIPLLHTLNAHTMQSFVEDTKVVLDIFLERGYNIDCTASGNGWFDSTLLHVAVGSNALEMVKYLFENGADINQTTSNHFAPLHRATSLDHNDIAKFLIASGANINALGPAARPSDLGTSKHAFKIDRNTKLQTTALFICIVRDNVEIAEILLRNGAVPQGFVELHESLKARHFRITNLILDSFTLDLTKDTIDLYPALHFLVPLKVAKIPMPYSIREKSDLDGIIQKYMKKGYDINVTDKNGRTILQVAVAVNALTLVKILIRRGADVNKRSPTSISNIADPNLLSASALFVAEVNNFHHMVKMLTENGAV